VDLGGLKLRAVATPGHTPEHLSYLLLEGHRPVALFSGGSLLVGAVARTDLIDPERTEELARALWRSLQDRVLALPDDLPVYPTHGAGSFCAAPAGAERTTTIGAEKAANPLLAAPDEDAFVKLLLGGFGTYPPYFRRLRDVNRRGPVVYGSESPTLPVLSIDQVRRRLDAGGLLVDVRPIASFANGHVRGALSIELRPAFATWLGWLSESNRDLIFVLEPDQDRSDLVRQARNIGFEHLVGEMAGGMPAWEAAGLPVARARIVQAPDITGPVLDVRQRGEFEAGHLPGALNVELGVLADAPEIDGRNLTVMCGHGERAMTAASVLARGGRREVAVAVGGPNEWAAARHIPLITGR
jgi:hydroxyacylglutathione hydrolase